MKKTALILTALLLALLCACSGGEADDNAALLSFSSPNGYTVQYADVFTPSPLSSSIDFVVMDEATGSTVTILTEEDTSSLELTKKDLTEEKKADGIDIDITSFKETEINGVSVIRAEYHANESFVTELIYDGGDKTFRATYTELPGTRDKLHSRMLAIINSLEVK